MLPDSLKKLARATRDFAELKMLYTDANELIADIRAALDLLHKRQETIDDLTRRVNQIRNVRDTMLVDIQDVVKRFDFTLRSL
jgi:muconolactone delta-isomerase